MFPFPGDPAKEDYHQFPPEVSSPFLQINSVASGTHIINTNSQTFRICTRTLRVSHFVGFIDEDIRLYDIHAFFQQAPTGTISLCLLKDSVSSSKGS